MKIQVGDEVQFVDPIHARYRFLDPGAVGVVTEILKDGMIQVLFGKRWAHGPEDYFKKVRRGFASR
jgi:hypothetical protein